MRGSPTLRRIGTVAAGLLLVAGCADEAPDRPADPSSATVAEPTPLTEPSGPDSSSAAPDSLTRLDLTGQDPAGFTAQGDAIACYFSTFRREASVRCDVLEASWSTPPKPRSCRGDWGLAAGITAGRPGVLLCISDTIAGIPDATDGSVPLEPNTVVIYGPLACTLQSNGVSCYDTGSSGEHSLFVSPLTYEVI